MELRFPDGDVRILSNKLEELSYQLFVLEKIPLEDQLFFQNRNLIAKNEPILNGSKLDLAIVIMDKYAICSKDLESEVFNMGYIPMIPPEAEVIHRVLKSISYTPRFHNINNVYSKNNELKKKNKERAKEWYKPYYENLDKRLNSIEKICQRLNTNQLVISTFNAPYIVLFKNFMHSCDQNGIKIREKLLIFPMDQESLEVCTQLDVAAYFEEGVYGKTTSKHKGYGDINFRICMFMKNAIIQDMLALGHDFLFQDIDMVWLKDPMSYLVKLADRYKYDFMFMFDGGNPRFQPLYYNSGFCYVRATDFSKRAWQVIFDNFDVIIGSYGSQQVPVNIIMNAFKERGLRTHLLDEKLILNGHLITSREDNNSNIDEETMVVHISWTGNLNDKLNRLKENNLWFLD